MKPAVRRYPQRGVVLLTTVMLLLLLTILALAGVSMNSLQTRIATHSADSLTAYQTAEGVLNQAENNLIAGAYSAESFAANTSGLYVFNPALPAVWTRPSVWSTAGAAIRSFQGGSNASGQFVIEKLPPVTKPGQSMKTPVQVYRITARAVGASGRSAVVLQSTLQTQ